MCLSNRYTSLCGPECRRFAWIKSCLWVHSPPRLPMSPSREARTVVDPSVATLQEGLRSSNGLAAWEFFLEVYSPVLYQIAAACSDDEDDAADCYLHICEQLSRNGFHRLLKFKPEGSARFTTWLRVVGRNLCYDWHRSHKGRRRPFKLLRFLSELDRGVYDCRFERKRRSISFARRFQIWARRNCTRRSGEWKTRSVRDSDGSSARGESIFST